MMAESPLLGYGNVAFTEIAGNFPVDLLVLKRAWLR
jgi:hypothetical protein